MQHRLEQMLRALAAGGLRGFQLADFINTLNKTVLAKGVVASLQGFGLMRPD